MKDLAFDGVILEHVHHSVFKMPICIASSSSAINAKFQTNMTLIKSTLLLKNFTRNFRKAQNKL